MEYYQKKVTPCLTPFMIDLKKEEARIRAQKATVYVGGQHTYPQSDPRSRIKAPAIESNT